MSKKRIKCPKIDKIVHSNNFCLSCKHRSSKNGGEYSETETCVLDGEIILLSEERCTNWEKW